MCAESAGLPRGGNVQGVAAGVEAGGLCTGRVCEPSRVAGLRT